VTVNLTNAHSQGKGFQVLEITGSFDTTTPIRQTKIVGTGSTVNTLSGDFDSAPLSPSMLLMSATGGESAGRSITADGSWTLVGTNGTASTLYHATQYRTGTTATGFSVSYSGTISLGIALNGIEIQEAAAPAGPVHPYVSITVSG
jgi:hypothetical protein